METPFEKVRIPLDGSLWKLVADEANSDLFLCLKKTNDDFFLYKKVEKSLFPQQRWNLKDEWVACSNGLFLFETIPQADLPILDGIKITDQNLNVRWSLPNVKYVGCSSTGICIQENKKYLLCKWTDGSILSTSSTPFTITTKIQLPDIFFPNTPYYESIETFVSVFVSVQKETPFEYMPTWFGFVVVCYVDQPSKQQVAILFSHEGKELDREILIEKSDQWKTPSIVLLNKQLIGLGDGKLIFWQSNS